ncbi:phospho-2-dehydro-3-deoxyheptonate aldolase, partial [Streptomyces sp. NRRL F-6602]
MALAAAVDEEDAGTSGAPPGPDVRPVPQAGQQPDWRDVAMLEEVRDDLRARPGLTRAEDVARLRRLLAEVAAGR